MKAIITNVKKSSGYSDYNGLTFDVVEILSNIICINIPSKICDGRFDRVDFSYSEVTIVDIQHELQSAYDNWNWGSDTKTFINLKKYCDERGIKYKYNYNRPA